jgi:hypothetical protein
MKTLIIAASFLIASSASACGSFITYQAFPTVALSEFGMNSWSFAKTTPVTQPTYDFSSCIEKEIHLGSPVPVQHFPSVPLDQFDMYSWTIAK